MCQVGYLRNMLRHGDPRPSITSTSFDVFFHGWLVRQQALLDELKRTNDKTTTVASKDADNGDSEDTDADSDSDAEEQLIQKVLNHYGEYYEEKAKLTSDDVFLVFCPPWLTALERAFLWVARFKPSMVFCLLQRSNPHMVSEQLEHIRRLQSSTMRDERAVSEALATIQEQVGSPELMELSRQVERLVNGQVSQFDRAMDDLKQAMRSVVERADNLRQSIVLQVVGLLDRKQKVKFLIEVAKFQLGVRARGLPMDTATQGEPSTS